MVQPRPPINPRLECAAEKQRGSFSPFLALLCLVIGFLGVCTMQEPLQQGVFSQTQSESLPPSNVSPFPKIRYTAFQSHAHVFTSITMPSPASNVLVFFVSPQVPKPRKHVVNVS